ncbi:protein kinase [Cyanobacterium aponinum AL20118]|uniref:non-specific serine/threonine protein kinase n=1 Tax=Cyanobacterium aponinum AL20115 TaxID=3090662 RepID=A0AAF0ZDJ5_9CHRO|nr:protein kinase [Cyanobacterium aponinum]WPF87364.1 protein kinase [Cyanobacterium aponinum AL20115]
MFKLNEIKDYPLAKIREISKQLNTADENPEYKLDCTDVYGLDDDVLEALFSAIRDDWKDARELDYFMTSLNGDLLNVIQIFLKNESKLEAVKNDVSNNFSFLTKPDLLKFATLAERYYLTDPETSLIKCRQFAELCARYVSAKVGLYEDIKDIKFIKLINELRSKNAIDKKVYKLFNDIRDAGNKVVHVKPEHITNLGVNNDNYIDNDYVITIIKKVHELAKWFHSAFCTRDLIKFDGYVVPSSNYFIDEPPIENNFDSDISTTIEDELSSIYEQTIIHPSAVKNNIDKSLECGNKIDLRGLFVNNEELENGLTIGSRYQIIEKLSQGSFGTTYLAEDLHLPDKPLVVVKQFTPNKSNEGTFSKAKHLFDQEATTLQKLNNNQNIPNLFAFFEENDKLFIVQEYIEGNTLRQELKARKAPYSEQEVIALMKNILTPLTIVHEKVIVHRDLKPENLICTTNNQIAIIDFGAIKQIIEDNNNSGTIIGTIGYMPPEQLEGSSISYSCDVYAVGIIAIEALMGYKIKDSILREEELKQSNISDGLKNILVKMTAFDPRDRYISALEALGAINALIPDGKDDQTETIIIPDPPTGTGTGSSTDSSKDSSTDTNTNTDTDIPKWYLIVGGIVFVLLGALFIRSLPYLTKTKLQQKELTIGTIWKPEASQGLADYIEENSVPANYFDFLKGDEIKVRINGDRTLSYPEAKTRMETKQWDIAFATSPMLSIFAKDQGYNHLAGMFPGSNSYNAGLFVRSDNPIQSINDINTSTKVALGSFTSASSFYMPVYDLYGKTVIADVGNRGEAIIEKVKNGEVDVGSAAIGDSVRKDDPTSRIIHVSRDIPGSGVYASPNLSKNDYENVKKLMLNAPSEIQKEANYEAKPEPDYTEFKKIVQRVEEILICADFTKNPVTLACTGNFQTIEGRINGVSVEGNNSVLKVSANGQIYNVIISLDLKQTVFGSDKLTDIQGKSVIIQSDKINNNNVTITQPNQLRVVDGQSQTNQTNVTTSANKVTKIQDGDALEIDNQVVRLACIDAPETKQKPLGEEATKFLTNMLPIGTNVTYRQVDTDNYGRIIAEVYKDNQLINTEIVRNGHAVVYTRFLSNCGDNQQLYIDAEAEAKQQQLGFWSQPNACLPWDFRRNKCS